MSATVAKILLGLDAEDMTASIETKEYCRVTLYNGGQDEYGNPYYVTYPVESSSESYYESGDLVRSRDQDTGDELVMDCAWLDSGTSGEKIGLQGKKIAKAVYNRIVGKQYNPFISNNAILNPLAEIGDGVLVNGHYAPIYRRVAYLDQLYTADISAPYKEEEDEEYPYEDRSITEFERIKKSIYSGVRASLTVTNDNINALVEQLYDENDGDIVTLSSQVDIQADKISLVVSESQGTNVINAASIVTSINNAASNVTISADHINLQGQTTFIATQSYADNAAGDAVDGLATDLASGAGTTVIDGGHITAGTIDADRIGAVYQAADTLTIGAGNIDHKIIFPGRYLQTVSQEAAALHMTGAMGFRIDANICPLSLYAKNYMQFVLSNRGTAQQGFFFSHYVYVEDDPEGEPLYREYFWNLTGNGITYNRGIYGSQGESEVTHAILANELAEIATDNSTFSSFRQALMNL